MMLNFQSFFNFIKVIYSRQFFDLHINLYRCIRFDFFTFGIINSDIQCSKTFYCSFSFCLFISLESFQCILVFF